MFILDLVIPIIEDVLYYLDVSWILRGSAADDTLCNIKHFGIHRIEWFYVIWNFEKGFRAASCKKSTRKNKLIRKNKLTRKQILYLKISVLVDLFFLINLFFLVDFLHEAALDVPDFAQFMAGKFGCVCRFFGTEKSTYLCGCLPKIIWIESSLDLHFYAGWSP